MANINQVEKYKSFSFHVSALKTYFIYHNWDTNVWRGKGGGASRVLFDMKSSLVNHFRLMCWLAHLLFLGYSVKYRVHSQNV